MNEAEESRAEMRKLADALARLEGGKVAVLGHVRPDGDCIGSQVAMTRYLRDIGVQATAVNLDPVPRILADFVDDTPFHTGPGYDLKDHLAGSVDCADGDRVGRALREGFDSYAFNVDHHVSNPRYAETNLVVPTASATAEILTEFFITAGYRPDRVSANALYVGIATDTGQFRFSSTTPRTFELCHILCEWGADPAWVANCLYERETFGRMVLLRRFLQSLRLEADGRVCLGLIDGAWYGETGTSSEDSEGFVDYARSIEGVEVGCFLESKGEWIKGSLRSKDPFFRVNEIAARFDGGGHACAAGFRVRDTMDTFVPRVLDTINEHLALLDREAVTE